MPYYHSDPSREVLDLEVEYYDGHTVQGWRWRCDRIAVGWHGPYSPEQEALAAARAAARKD